MKRHSPTDEAGTLVLLDYLLEPDKDVAEALNGSQVVELLRRQWPRMMVVLVTAEDARTAQGLLPPGVPANDKPLKGAFPEFLRKLALSTRGSP